ncbi:MAG: carboxy terminal-processing peptidase [Bacteroidota bacterium]
MFLKKSLFFSLAAVTMLAAFVYPEINEAEKEKILQQTLLRSLNKYHFAPQDLNDDFSNKAFDRYLESLDGGKRFLVADEVAQLSRYRDQMDDHVQSGEFPLFNESMALMDKALDRARGYYQAALEQPFNFDAQEQIEMDADKRKYEADETALQTYWGRYLKYETLDRYAEMLAKKADEHEDYVNKTEVEMEAEAREEVRKMFDRWFVRMGKMDREDRMSQYLNSMTGVFDPHTNYYKPIDKENFDIRFSGKLEGIGARLIGEGDYTKVSEVVVGGPAWKGKELEDNDIIKAVAQGDEKPVDIMGMVLDDVVQLIRGDKGTEVRLTVEKVDGSEQVISIIRDVVILDERFAKSLILDGRAGETIGYIYLPSFYADFSDRNGRHCADDVEKEITKLKNVGVDGIILDLRNNGGGSLRDVVKMSGFFIEQGPVVQVKSRDYDAEVLMDVNPEVQYDGPLVVMVNQSSASASEILAAALQDYGRAVVVGSKSTFGKGTVQRFFDLDRTLRGYEDAKPLGQVKLTTQKFYRINGGSTQLRGVTPDIILPDNYAFIKTGEKEHEYALPWTEIDAVDYKQNVLQLSHLKQIANRSAARTNKSETFGQISSNAARLRKRRDLSSYPLNLEAYQNLEASLKADADRFDNLFDEVVIPSARNLEVDLPAFENDESKQARNEDFLKSVSKDVYIQEVLSIIHDIIDLEGVAVRD